MKLGLSHKHLKDILDGTPNLKKSNRSSFRYDTNFSMGF